MGHMQLLLDRMNEVELRVAVLRAIRPVSASYAVLLRSA